MDLTLFLFLQVMGLFFLLYGFQYNDVRAGLTIFATLIFQMLSVAAWNVTRDFVEVVNINATDTITSYTITYVWPEIAKLNMIFMWVSVLWIIYKVMYNAEAIVSGAKFTMSEMSRKMK